MPSTHHRAFDHVLVIMFENQYREYVMANPYFRGLARQGIDMASYFGVMHPSQTNYIASIAGELCNVTSDDQPPPLPQRTIVDLIEESPDGLAWKAYCESYIPQNTPWTPTLVPKDEYPYVIKHNPFSSFANILRSESRWARITDESQLFKDLLNGEFPEFAWFTPNMWNDGHYTDGTKEDPPERAPALVDQAAVWLEGFFGSLRFPGAGSHLPPRTLVVVTFDEADFEANWDANDKYTYDGPNQVYTVLLGNHLAPAVEEESYNHYSLLRTIEENFALGTLGKNDAAANWFQFLWARRFRWGGTEPTPICTNGPLAAAELAGLLFVVYRNDDGHLEQRVLRDSAWSEPQRLDVRGGDTVAMTRCSNQLVLAVSGADGIPVALTYDFTAGWSAPLPLATQPASEIALAAFGNGDEVMCAFRGADGAIQSRRFSGGVWGDIVPTGHSTDGSLALGALGPSLFLVFTTPRTTGLSAVSYNAAPFNVVTDPVSQYSGPYDDTTQDAWSPSAFPVARFGAATSPVTPGEEEPQTLPFAAGQPLAMASLDGVLHLVHPGPGNPLLLEETFSVPGVMTAKLKVSYNASDETTTSDGYGTLAEAGWNPQRPVNGAALAERGRLACTRAENELVLVFHSGCGGRVALCRGRFEKV